MADDAPVEHKEIEDEPPPVLRTWSRAYMLVVAYLALLIVLFYLFTKHFAP
jgi:hypothetical protein